MANKANKVTDNVKQAKKSPKPTDHSSGSHNQQQISSAHLLVARAQRTPDRLTPTDTLRLQRTMGNRAVSLMLARTGQQIVQTKSEFTDHLEKMKEAIKKQQELLDKMQSPESTKSGEQQQGSTGTGQASEQGQQTTSSTAGTGGSRWQAGDLDEPRPGITPPGHYPGKKRPGRPFRPLKHLLKQMGFGPGIKPGRRRPGRPPRPLRHLLKQMRFGPGM